TSTAQGFVMLTIYQVCLGLGASGYHPSSFPALAEKFPNARAKATGIQAMGGLLGMAVTPFVGVTLLIATGTWQSSLQVLAIVGVVLFVPTFLLMRYSHSEKANELDDDLIHEPEEEEHIEPDGWTRNYWLLVLLVGLRGMAFRCTSLLMPLYLTVTYLTGVVTAGYLTAVMLTAGLIGEVVSSYYSDKWNRRVPFLIISSGVAAPALLLLNFQLSSMMLVLVLIVIGFFFYLGVPPNVAYQTEVCPRNSTGLAFGILFSFGAIPGALAPIIFGIIADNFGLAASILFLVITTLLATVVALFLKDTKTEGTDPSKIVIVDAELE
ncbi:MAG: MFS transporter, partial [Candidatus Thorarchaeota archaeon]|nr:MFS transporter [Candidatus Thorarchaeota archaeon]